LKVVDVLSVARPELWSKLDQDQSLAPHVVAVLDPCRRAVGPGFLSLLPNLQRQGLTVLVRRARRPAAEAEAHQQELAELIAGLPPAARDLLHRAQRHSHDGIVRGAHTWDPENDSVSVNTLHGAGLMRLLPTTELSGEEGPREGRYQLDPDLPPAPPLQLDVSDAVMERTDDLPAAGPGPVELLHDLAALAAALRLHPAKRTRTGTIELASGKRLGHRLGSSDLAADGDLVAHPRWARALSALEALGVVLLDGATRTLHVEPGVEDLLAGSTSDAIDRLCRRLIEPDLRLLLPVLRVAIAQADGQALDEVVLLDLIAEQQRDLVFAPWTRNGVEVYPTLDDRPPVAWSRPAFDRIEAKMIDATLRRLVRLGLVVRAPGVLAPTPDGALWASQVEPPAPPVWVGSDLELLVPPGSVTPWERYQLEALGRCVHRDVVDRYRLEAGGVDAWLSTHELNDALDLLRRRCPGVPAAVEETLRGWASAATRIVLTRGVVL
jgi:hypothetical protein